MLRVFCLAALLVLMLPLQGCMFVNIPLTLPSQEYQEVPVETGRASEKILILDIDGIITSGVREESPFMLDKESIVNQVAGKLRKAREDGNIKAVILRIDSPGGGVTASDVVYKMIRDFREEEGIPVYACLLDVAASGGYYIAMAADEIYAHPTTVTGSIGVIAMIPQLEGLGQKIGVHFEIIKSGDNKDIGGIFRDMSDEQRSILQGTIDSMHERFIEAVVAGRPNLDEKSIRRLADGRIYTAAEAGEYGLIDGIMYLDDMVKMIKTRHELRNPRVMFYRRTARSSYNSFYAQARNPVEEKRDWNPITVGLINIDGSQTFRRTHPVFQYLWVP